MKTKAALNIVFYILFAGSAFSVILILLFILTDIFTKGFQTFSWTFLVENPKKGMTEGGIYPAILGTVITTFVSTLVSMPLGISCAIYLNEYAPKGHLQNLIRACIRNLSGVPSIIYGLFGLAIFVQALQMGTSILAAGLTLGLLSLPYVVTTAEEALKTVPNSLREATLALGATKFETLKDVVLPQATPGIMTGLVLALSRAAGETAPILFTGVTFYINQPSFSLHHEFMALPYHIYVLSTQHSSVELVRPIAYATASMLISIVFIFNLFAFFIRHHYSKNK
ncbi:MAG: phosphate ABC transporter permease PstA [Cytophagales bacterium]